MLREVAVRQAGGGKCVDSFTHSVIVTHFLEINHSLFRGNILICAWRDCGTPQKTAVRTVGDLAEIQIRYLPNTSPKHYWLSQLACGFYLGSSGNEMIMQACFQGSLA
jgi:hypothetical protein